MCNRHPCFWNQFLEMRCPLVKRARLVPSIDVRRDKKYLAAAGQFSSDTLYKDLVLRLRNERSDRVTIH